MARARHLLAAFVLALGASASAAPPPDAPPPAPPTVAQDVRAAFAAGDAARLRDLARRPEPDPFLVAHALWATHVREHAGTDRAEAAPLRELDAYVAAAGDRVDAEGLAALASAWKGLDVEGVRRERAALVLLDEADAAAGPGPPATTMDSTARLAASAAMRATLARGTTRCLLASREARTWIGLRKPLAAVAPAAAAAEDARDLGWLRARADLGRLLGDAGTRAGSHAAAVEGDEDAIDALRRLGRAGEVPSVRLRLANAYRFLGRFADGLAQAELALAESSTGPPRGRANAEQVVGLTLAQLGRTADALAALARAADLYRSAGETRHAAKMGEFRAGVLLDAGRLEEALEAIETSVATARALEDPAFLGGMLEERGKVLSALGRHAEAVADLREAAAQARAAGNVHLTAMVLWGLGRTERARFAPAEALVALEQASRGFAEVGDRRRVEAVATDRASSLLVLGRLDEAEQALREAAPRGLETLPPAERLLLRCQRGRLEELRGATAQALVTMRGIAEDLERAGLPADAAVLRAVARLELAEGHPEEATRAAQRALAARASRLGGLGVSDAPTRPGLLRADADLMLRAAAAWAEAPGSGGEAAFAGAFEATERGRVLSLVEALQIGTAAGVAPASRGARVRWANARSRVDAAQRRLLSAAFGPSAGTDGTEASRARAELDAGLAEAADARAVLERERRRDADLVGAPPVGPDDGMLAHAAALADGGSYVAYHLGEDEAWALVVTAKARTIRRLAEPARIARTAAAWLRSLAARDPLSEAPLAREAYGLLVAPIADRLGPGPRILVAPDGVLSFLPFDALLEDGPTGPRRLVETREIANTPSATVLRILALGGALDGDTRREALGPTRVLALGDPVYPGESGASVSRGGLASLDRLAASGEEVRDLAALFPGRTTTLLRADATLEGLLAALAAGPLRWRAVHLACHGFANPESPRASGLVLGGGSVLGLETLWGLRIPAELVFLSACETGLGRVESGDGVLGLVRGFFSAGATRVVASSFSVDDAPTRRLVRVFYEGLRAGSGPATALTRAKRSLIAEGGPDAAPRRWAAWTLWGLPD